MKTRFTSLFSRMDVMVFAIAAAMATAVAESALDFADSGFEAGGNAWSNAVSAFSAVIPDAAFEGALGLRITDASETQGSSVRSAPVPVVPEAHYALRFQSRILDGSGMGVYVEYRDADGANLSTQERGTLTVFAVPADDREWTAYTVVSRAPADAAALTVWLHSFNASTVTADLDAFSVSRLTDAEAQVVRTSPQAARAGTQFRVVGAERIAEIAALLPAEPRGIGTPISDRGAWDRLRALERADGVIDQAERYAETPPPELPDDLYLEFTRTGNRRNYERPYATCILRIEYLAVAECLEDGGRFVPALVRDMRAMCAHRSWLLPACDPSLTNFHGTNLTVALGSSRRAWVLATVLYWLQDRLPPDVREQVRGEIRRRVLDPYLVSLRAGTTGGNWWIRGTNNWNPVCTAGCVGAALALIDDATVRAECLAGMEISNPYFLSGFTEDGYCSEGVGYWNYGFGHYMMLGVMVREATGGKLDIFQDQRLQAIARFPINILIQPGIAPAFADCSVRARPSDDVLALIDRVFPDIIPGDVRTPHPLTGSVIGTAFHALGGDLAAEPVSITAGDLPLHSWFEQAGILVSRGRPDAEAALGAAIKGGHNGEHHNHNDVGSFVVVLNGQPLLLDPGGEVYTRRTFSAQRYESPVLNSYGHPVPRVAGQLQIKGRAAAAEVIDAAFTETHDRLVLELKQAYRVPALQSLRRTFVHDREARIIRVEDRLACAEPTDFEGCLITLDRVHRVGPGILAVYDDARAVSVHVTVTGADWELVIDEIENPGRPTPKRLGIRLGRPVAAATIAVVIRPRPLRGLPGVYTEPEWTTLQPLADDAITVQAEDVVAESGGEVDVCEKVGADGQALKFWHQAGHSLTWRVEVPQRGRYAVRLRCCHAWQEPVTRTLEIDGAPAADTAFVFPFTGGWSTSADNWRLVWLALDGSPVILDLAAGQHTLTMSSEGATGLNVDWLQLVPVAVAE